MRSLTAALWILSALPVAAQGTLTDIDDRTHVARKIAFSRREKTLWIRFETPDGKERSMDARDVVQIRFRPLENRTRISPADIAFVFTNGDLLYGTVQGPGKKPDTVRIKPDSLEPLDLPFAQAKRIEILKNRKHIDPDLESQPGFDIFLETSGNRRKGILAAFRPDPVLLEDLDSGERFQIPLKDLAAVYVMKPGREEDLPPEDPKDLFAVVTFTDGSSIRGHIEKLEGGILTFTSLYGTTFRAAAGGVASIHFRNGRVVYLSDLDPDVVDEDPNYIRGIQPSESDLRFPFRKDRSVKDTKLSIRGKTFSKGLGVHAHSELEYELDGGFRTFRATIGIDDVARGLGHVVFEVHVDDRKVFDSGAVTGRDPPREIEVDVQGASRLRLIVRFGEQGNTGDCADWAAARLIR